MLQWEKPWVKIHRVAQFVALLNGVWAVLHRPQRLPTGADPPPSPPLVHGAGLRHSARQETACRCSRSRAVISSEPCGCVTAFHYQFMHRPYFFFIFLHGGQQSCSCDANGTGEKGTSRLTQPGGQPTRVSRSLINPDGEDSLSGFFFSWLIACCVADGNSKASVDITFCHFFPTLAKKHT